MTAANIKDYVSEFHAKFDVPDRLRDGQAPEVIQERVNLRHALIQEEFKELSDALYAHGGPDLIETADALADMVYVIYGAALEFGIDLDAVLAEVHRSNLTKVWPDGTIHKREDGKVVKPPTYSPADVAGVLGVGRPTIARP